MSLVFSELKRFLGYYSLFPDFVRVVYYPVWNGHEVLQLIVDLPLVHFCLDSYMVSDHCNNWCLSLGHFFLSVEYSRFHNSYFFPPYFFLSQYIAAFFFSHPIYLLLVDIFWSSSLAWLGVRSCRCLQNVVFVWGSKLYGFFRDFRWARPPLYLTFSVRSFVRPWNPNLVKKYFGNSLFVKMGLKNGKTNFGVTLPL